MDAAASSQAANPGPPTVDLQRVAGAQGRFSDRIAGLDDAGVRRPSTLPGWTVAHLLTHVARNADSHIRRAEAAALHQVIDQYPGGFAGRTAEIDLGAGRTAAELVADVDETARRLASTWARLPDDAWGAVTRDVGGRERPLWALVARRWQELEVHLVDLDLGDTPRGWSDAFVATFLPRVRSSAPDRLAPGTALPAPGTLDERDELAWLYGRLDRPDLPALAPWS